jgi:hypothetical protein
MTTDTYILAPHNAQNFAVLQSALDQFPEIVQEQRVKYVYRRHANDIVSEEGTLLVPYLSLQYIYLCATVPADSPVLAQFLQGLSSYSLYNIDNQPFGDYWL